MKKTHSASRCTNYLPDYPVSEKFYNEIVDRINVTFRTVPYYNDATENYAAAEQCVRTVDDYLLTGCQPDEKALPPIRLMFALLKPELDKAMSRSAVARGRRRKTAPKPVSAPKHGRETVSSAPAAEQAEKAKKVGKAEKAKTVRNTGKAPEMYDDDFVMRRMAMIAEALGAPMPSADDVAKFRETYGDAVGDAADDIAGDADIAGEMPEILVNRRERRRREREQLRRERRAARAMLTPTKK